MRRIFAASLCLLLAISCGSKGKDKKTDSKTDTKTDTKTAEPTKPAMTKEQMLQRVWAAPKSTDGTKALLEFKADGTYSYHVFNGKTWDAPQVDKYTVEGDTLKDTGNSYKLALSESKISLDNAEKDKTDFLDWHLATTEDCNPAADPPCPTKPSGDAAAQPPATPPATPASTPTSTPAETPK